MTTTNFPKRFISNLHLIGVRRGVSKGLENSHRLPALQARQPGNGPKAISGVAHPQAVEG